MERRNSQQGERLEVRSNPHSLVCSMPSILSLCSKPGSRVGLICAIVDEEVSAKQAGQSVVHERVRYWQGTVGSRPRRL